MLKSANILLNNEEYEEAINLYKKFIDNKPEKDDLIAAYYNIAQAYDGLKQYIQSAQYYQKVIQLDPKFHNGQVYWEQGQLYQLAKKYKQSKQVYLKYLKFQPNHLESHYNIGKASLQLGQNDAALKYFTKAIQLKPNYKKPYEEIISILKGRKEYEEVIKKCTAFLKHEPNDYSIIYQEGYALLMLKRYNEAALAFKQCTNFNKQFVKSYLGLGETYLKLQKYKQSLEILTNCLEINENTIRIIEKKQIKLLIGINYEKMQKFSQSLNCFRQIISQKPVNEAAKSNLIRLLQKQGNRCLKNKCFSDALTYYKEILIHSTAKNSSLFNNMGLAYQNINNFKEAEKYFNQVLKIQPKNEEALNNIGILYKATGRIRDSEDIFKRLAEEFPLNSKFIINYAKIQMENHKYKEALDLFFKAQKLIKNQNNYELYNDISVALQKQNRFQEALVYANKANSLVSEKSPLVLLNRAKIFMDLNNSILAKSDFENAAAILRSPDKTGLRMFGINELNLKFMFGQLDQYAYLMSPIQTFREGLVNDIKKLQIPQEKPFPTVINKVEKAQQFVLSKIIPTIVKTQLHQDKVNPEQSRHFYNQVMLMVKDIRRQYQYKLAQQNKKIEQLQKSVHLQKQQSQEIKKLLRYLPQSAKLRQKFDDLQHKDKIIFQYGKQLYWILNGYLKGYMLISTGVVGKGQNINRSTFNKAVKTVGGILQFTQAIPVIGQFSELISKICGLFVDLEDDVIIKKVYQVISFNYNTEQDLNDAICHTVLLFLNDQKKLKRVRQNLLFKPSEGLMNSIKQTIEDIKDWFNEKKSQFILHMRGFQKCQNIEQSQLAVIDVGSIISVLLNMKSNSLQRIPAITNAARRVLADEQMQKMIIQSYERENNNLRVSNNGFCIIMKCQIIYNNCLLNDRQFINYLKRNKKLTKRLYNKILDAYDSRSYYQMVELLLLNQYQKISQMLVNQ